MYHDLRAKSGSTYLMNLLVGCVETEPSINITGRMPNLGINATVDSKITFLHLPQ